MSRVKQVRQHRLPGALCALSVVVVLYSFAGSAVAQDEPSTSAGAGDIAGDIDPVETAVKKKKAKENGQ